MTMRSTPSPNAVRPSSPQFSIQSHSMSTRSPVIVGLSSHFGSTGTAGPISPSTTTANHTSNSSSQLQSQSSPVQVATNSTVQGPNLRAGLSRRVTHPPLPLLSQSPGMLAPSHMGNVGVPHGHGLPHPYGHPQSLQHHSSPHSHTYGPSNTTNSPQTPLRAILQPSQPSSSTQPHSHSRAISVQHPSQVQVQAHQRARGQSVGGVASSAVSAITGANAGAAAATGSGQGTGSGMRPPPRISAEPDESNIFYHQIQTYLHGPPPPPLGQPRLSPSQSQPPPPK